ncbi:MAG TPA: DUF2267 domain-containing protein [Devosiaceae bacterium]
MSEKYVAVLDKGVQDAHAWINEIDKGMLWDNPQRSYRLLRAVLHALRDWLNADEAAQLSAQLPLVIRGIYFEGWNPSATPAHPRTKEDFVARVQLDFRTDPIAEPDWAISTVFMVLARHVSAGEIDEVRGDLRKALRDLWPE